MDSVRANSGQSAFCSNHAPENRAKNGGLKLSRYVTGFQSWSASQSTPKPLRDGAVTTNKPFLPNWFRNVDQPTSLVAVRGAV